jgi:peptidylprolyl isomerase
VPVWLLVLLLATPVVAGDLPSEGLFAVFETTLGRFVCELDYENAPVTVGNFVGLAEGTQDFLDPRTRQWVRRPFYDGLKIHRIVKGFVVQGGDPLGDGTGGPGYAFMDEFSAELLHDRPGVLSMANAGPGTNGSQFFITLAAAPQLDHRYSVFGQVISGMEVLQEMARQPLMGPKNSTPVTDIVIQSVRIVRRGAEAQAFDAQEAFAQQEQIAQRRNQHKKECAEVFRNELARDLAVAESTSSGLRYVVRKPGTGDTPKVGDTVAAHYVGFLEDGSRFDSSYDRKEPFTFPVGQGQVIKGWDEVFQLMREGEMMRVIIPPELAYGKRGHRQYGIPPGATLVFDVELVDIVSH